MAKAGPISDETKQWIVAHQAEFTPEEMAEQLNMKVPTVKKLLNTFSGVISKNVQWRERLKRSVAWKQLRQEFDENELDYFVDKYMQLMEQFKEDVLPTEEQQIFNIIRVEILMSRAMAAKRSVRGTIDRLEQMQNGLLQQHNNDVMDMDEDARQELASLEEQIITARQAESHRSTEYINLQKEHNNLTDNLKAGRSQRIKNATDTKISFSRVVEDLMDYDKQERESRTIELGRLALDKEYERLGKPIKYLDNTVDLPVLCDRTLEAIDKQEKDNAETE